ncbi:MAG TPA: beta-ketoacyl-[acyl-carrier-protein] synthase family protein [Anaerolineae bacterium]|nr:beta-ketoacyl-[acyl-carrier-protein] synthase family protein [Anaerolineae bacterium]
MERRVVVTGVGVVTPIGLDVKSFWDAICAGRSGVRLIDAFDTSQFNSQVAGVVEGFDSQSFVTRREALHLDRCTLLAVGAATEALANSCLNGNDAWHDRAGVVMGTGVGGVLSLSEQMEVLRTSPPRFVSPFLMPMMLNNSASGFLAIHFRLKGPSTCVSTACASGSSALSIGCNWIRAGQANVVLAGGTEAAITPIILAAFDSLKALATGWNQQPEAASRPFDAARAGFVISEGAAALVLEERCHALDRGAPILAEIAGWGETTDAHHMFAPAPNGQGVAQAMRLAIERAQLDAGAVDYVNAHATSTPLGDEFEACAIREVLGARTEQVPVSAIKSLIGHTLGAAGALAVVSAILSLQHGLMPATLNLTHPDPACRLNHVVGGPRRADLTTALVNAAGFGGHNVSILLTSPQALPG